MSSLSGPPSLPLAGGTISGALTVTGALNANGAAAFAQPPTASNTTKAWVYWNGTGTVAINAAHNVSSITDNGVGDYTVNFTTAMADANFCWTQGTKQVTAGNNNTLSEQSRSASALRVQCLSTQNGVPQDNTINCVAVWR